MGFQYFKKIDWLRANKHFLFLLKSVFTSIFVTLETTRLTIPNKGLPCSLEGKKLMTKWHRPL